jgi:cytochrome oxidase assembly protein ShyY1
MIAQHNLAARPAVFFWYDVPSLMAVTKAHGIALAAASLKTTTETESTTAPRHDSPGDDLVLMTIVSDQTENSNDTAAKDTAASAVWPLVPTGTALIDGRIHPAVHIGYAVTWYGLCAAGIVMTRRLATRGRS